MLFDSTILDDLSAGISHIGSLQAQRAAQTRWWHHSQVLQGQSKGILTLEGSGDLRLLIEKPQTVLPRHMGQRRMNPGR